MKLIQLVTAYTALLTLSDMKLDAQTAFDVYDMKRTLLTNASYFMNQEMKLASKYAAKREDGSPDIRDGRVIFAGADDTERTENAAAYNAARQKLCLVDADCKYESIESKKVLYIPSSERIMPSVFEALEPIARVVVNGSEL